MRDSAAMDAAAAEHLIRSLAHQFEVSLYDEEDSVAPEQDEPLPQSLWLRLLSADEAPEEHDDGARLAPESTAGDELQQHLASTFPDEAARSSIRSSVREVLLRCTQPGAGAAVKEAAAGELAELLGFEHLDLISHVLENPYAVLPVLDRQPVRAQLLPH